VDRHRLNQFARRTAENIAVGSTPFALRRRSREGDKESETAKKIGLTLSGLAVGKNNR
jgi:hypothetical protein